MDLFLKEIIHNREYKKSWVVAKLYQMRKSLSQLKKKGPLCDGTAESAAIFSDAEINEKIEWKGQQL